ncbi:MAG: STM4015 family protein [Planctomycetota bacterium]
MINENLTEFYGKPVIDFYAGKPLPNTTATAYRVRVDWEDFDNKVTFTDRFDALLTDPGAGGLEALIIGDWGGAGQGEDVGAVIAALVKAKDRLPNLKALFIGDMVSEESEISWIEQGDLSALWPAYPNLEEFGARGGNNLSLGDMALPQLKKLVVEAGGLPPNVLEEIANASLPQLEHLELWLGTTEYGGDTAIDDVRLILNASCFPKLRYLGLRNSEIADDIAALVGGSKIAGQLSVLDLSLGTLTDKGAEALASAGNLGGLQKLDIHYHFISQEVLGRLREIGVALDASDPQEPDEYGGELHYYVAVSE